MSFRLQTSWQASDAPEGEFNRDHLIHFGSGQKIQASSAPEYKGNSAMVNPEESLLAALSSCHMLTFLAIAHLKRLPVKSYNDNALAELGKRDNGKLAVNYMQLNPEVEFVEGVEVSRETLEKMHEKAHANCFIANTLDCEVEIRF
ncbi:MULTISPECIES: OsmC family protein [Shewanella]|uniref:OsmC family protein n=2 Tax=Shewanella TaxID=22 RepID=A0AAJ1BIS5_9GAMM|nr:OsmC family protein [Shewanella khirikhana]AZQ11279.1 OsmC-like protein [Shewanella khirikhana]MCH4295482.1 OsmC family protein [Shewanella zhuhaiensis]